MAACVKVNVEFMASLQYFFRTILRKKKIKCYKRYQLNYSPVHAKWLNNAKGVVFV